MSSYLRPAILAIAALGMAMPATAPRAEILHLSLCGGGAIDVPLDRPPQRRDRPDKCCAAACHAGERRRRHRLG